MYKIVFRYAGGQADETYGGGSYIVNGEKFAVLNNENPKLYRSERVARNAAEKLFESCVNTGVEASVEEV